MERKQLANTDAFISAMGLGALHLSLSTRPSESQGIAVIHRALDLGITLIDTADSYCIDELDKHHNEQLIRKALQQYNGDVSTVIIATKGGLMRPNGDWKNNGNPDHLRKAIQMSFEALGGDKPIDVWQYHAPDPKYTIEGSLAPAKKAVDEGLIRFVGVSNFSVEQIKQARNVIEIVSVQNQYNPWHRRPEFDGILDYCEQKRLTFLPWRPLGGSNGVGRLRDIPLLSALAEEKGISIYCLVLAWVRAKSPCIVPIPGTSEITSMEDSVSAAEVKLSTEEVSRIEGMLKCM